ncbi:SDR family oxidoreductase [Microbispora hainanensis]|uniref:SDR family NAD(P)-dependent oxidoreductase n=1 Tax=Microbispora hainanensis TaxID=568844 RepID=UPI00340FD8D5
MDTAPSVEELFTVPGKRAVVVGAGRGIGRAVAALLARAGATVVAADIDPGNAAATAQAITADGGEAYAVAVDVADPGSVTALGDQVAERCGGLDILVNTAAIFRLAAFLEATPQMWDDTYQVNLRGMFLTTQMAVRLMRAGGGGSIVNFSSVASQKPGLLDQAHYDAEKAGVSAMSRAAAAEFAGDGIRVNTVVPGAVMTEGAADYSGRENRGPITQPGRILLNRYGKPVDMAATVLFLVSPAGSFITGQDIVGDGGFLLS